MSDLIVVPVYLTNNHTSIMNQTEPIISCAREYYQQCTFNMDILLPV